MSGKVLQFLPRHSGPECEPLAPIVTFPGFARTTKDLSVARSGDLELWTLNTDLADLDTALRFVEREGSLHYQKIQALFRDLQIPRVLLGDAKRNEIEILGIGRIEISRFRQVVDYIVLVSPTEGSFCLDYHQTVGRFHEVSSSAILALTSEKLIPLVQQYRHSVRGLTLELPRGARNLRETPEECALREGKEEAGIVTSSQTELIDLGLYYPDTGFIAHRAQLIAATHIEILPKAQSHDFGERIHGVELVSAAELLQMISRGEINDGHTATAVLRAWAKGIL